MTDDTDLYAIGGDDPVDTIHAADAVNTRSLTVPEDPDIDIVGAVPIAELEALADKWDDSADDHREESLVHDATVIRDDKAYQRVECANELRDLIETHARD